MMTSGKNITVKDTHTHIHTDTIHPHRHTISLLIILGLSTDWDKSETGKNISQAWLTKQVCQMPRAERQLTAGRWQMIGVTVKYVRLTTIEVASALQHFALALAKVVHISNFTWSGKQLFEPLYWVKWDWTELLKLIFARQLDSCHIIMLAHDATRTTRVFSMHWRNKLKSFFAYLLYPEPIEHKKSGYDGLLKIYVTYRWRRNRSH